MITYNTASLAPAINQQGIDRLIHRFLASLDISQSSRRVHKAGIQRFTKYLTDNYIFQPELEDLIAYRHFLKDEQLSALTIQNYLVAVRHFFGWLETKRIYPDISRQLHGPKKDRGFQKEPISKETVHKLLNHIDTSTVTGMRDFALINFLIRTGLLTIEIRRADTVDINQRDGEYIMRIQGKGSTSKNEFVILTDNVLNPLKRYLEARGGSDGPLFSARHDRHQRLTTRSISGIVKKRLKSIGIDDPRITAHSLRHTAVTLALQAGATLQEAQSFARYANINTTLIYAHNLDRMKRAAERKVDAFLGAINEV